DAPDPSLWPGEQVSYFVADLRIVEGYRFGDRKPHHDTTRSWVNRLRLNGMAYLKEFGLAAYGLERNDTLTEEMMDRIAEDAQIFRGRELDLIVDPPKRNGYLHHNFSLPSMSGIDMQAMAAGRRRAGS